MPYSARGRAAAVVVALVCSVTSVFVGPGAQAASRGSVAVLIKTPTGVPANVVLKGPARAVVAKHPAGAKFRSSRSLRPGKYSVTGPVFTFNGNLYKGTPSRSKVSVQPGRTVGVTVTFVKVDAASRLRATDVRTDSVSLAWVQPNRASIALRRAVGDAAPATVRQGAAVKTTGGQAVDSGLTPGSSYSYSLFTKSGRRWVGPVSVTVGTPTPTSHIAYVAPVSSTMVQPQDSDTVTLVGGVVTVKLASGRPTPIEGSGFSLPPSQLLPGGFVGTVRSVSADGRTLTLAPGGLADMFDYLDLDLDLADTGPITPQPITNPAAAAAALKQDALRTAQRAAASRGVSPQQTLPASTLESCLGGSSSQQLSIAPILHPGGHFRSGIVKTWKVPTGAWYDVEATMETGLKLSFKTTSEISCGLPFEPVMKTLTLEPVPISLMFEPIAKVSAEGEIEISNLGMTVTSGFAVAGEFGLNNSIDGHPIASVTPMTPDIKATGAISAQFGGELTIGPGVGSADAGVIAGVGGQLIPLKLSAGAVFGDNDLRHDACLFASASTLLGLSLQAKAWLGSWSKSKTVTLDALQKEFSYGGSPWHFPTDCEKAPDPTTDAVGDGVTVNDSSTTGSPSQWGHTSGFAPGEDAWVLSTGNVADAVGTPDYFASSDMGQPGSAALSSLAGSADSYDAAGYHVTLTPSGNTLHIRFAFASEEYPEYVGAGFNDVMAIWVGGQNCALVPGTDIPVSVDNINDTTNSQYYVDNQTGASGYSTSMDGLTVPLTCNVPVTPGQPVDVNIAIADVGDGIYDSAIALLDKGIWSD